MTAAAAVTVRITVLRATKLERNKADSGEDEYISATRKSPTAEVGARCDRHAPLQDEESTGQPMLVVRHQAEKRRPPHVPMSQIERERESMLGTLASKKIEI